MKNQARKKPSASVNVKWGLEAATKRGGAPIKFVLIMQWHSSCCFSPPASCLGWRPQINHHRSRVQWTPRYKSVIQCYSIYIYIYWTLYFIDVGLGEDERTNTVKPRVYKRLEYVFIFLLNTPLYNEHNWEDSYIHSGKSMHVHFLYPKPNQGRFNFPSWILLMVHCRIASTIQIWTCKYGR